MLVFTCVASGIVLLRAAGRLKPARERMELPFGEGSLSDTLRRLPDPLKGQETNIYRTIKQPQQNGNRKSNMEEEHVPVGEAPEGTRPAEAGSVPSEGTKTEKRLSGEEILRHRKYIVIPVFVLVFLAVLY